MTELFMLTETSSFGIIPSDKIKFIEEMRKQEVRNKINNSFSGLKFDIVLQDGDVFGNNKRLYRTTDLQKSMEIFAQKRIKRGHALMEENHPIDPTPTRFSTIVQSNSVMSINGYHFVGNELHGSVETLNNRIGIDFKNVLLQGTYQGSSSLRARGSVRKTRGGSIVDSNFNIITFDSVTVPSFKNATIKKMLTESDVKSLISDSDALKTSLDMTGQWDLVESSEFKPDEDGNIIMCNDGSCMKVLLESHLANCLIEDIESF